MHVFEWSAFSINNSTKNVGPVVNYRKQSRRHSVIKPCHRLNTGLFFYLVCIALAAFTPLAGGETSLEQHNTDNEKAPPPANYVVTQRYKLLSPKKGGSSKNLQQTLYVSPEWFKIDDDQDTFIIHFGKKTLEHREHIGQGGGTYFIETFDEIERRVSKRRKNVLERLKTMRDGPDKDEYGRLWSGLIEINRKYKIELSDCDDMVGSIRATKRMVVKAYDKWNNGTVVIDGLISENYRIPAENARVLFLLELAGERLAERLKGINGLPLRLKLVLPDGGTAESEVTKLTVVRSHPPTLLDRPRNYRKKGEKSSVIPGAEGSAASGFKPPVQEFPDDDEDE